MRLPPPPFTRGSPYSSPGHKMTARLTPPGPRVLEKMRVSVKAYKAKMKAEEAAAKVTENADHPTLTPQSPLIIDLSDCDPETPDDSTVGLETIADSQPELELAGTSTPRLDSPGDFEWLAKITPDPDNPGDYMIRKSPVTPPSSSYNNLIDDPVVYMMPPKHNYPVKPNLDYLPPPDPPTEPPSEPPSEPTSEPPRTAEEPLPDKITVSVQTKKKAGTGRRKGKKKTSVKDKKVETKEEKKKESRVVVKSVQRGERQSSRLTADQKVTYADPEFLEDVHFCKLLLRVNFYCADVAIIFCVLFYPFYSK